MISVIIQALNNQATLPACLAALVPAAVDAIVREVTIVDGGSTDATLAIAEDAGARVVGGLEEAVARAKSDWLLLLPPTVQLEAGWAAEAAAHVQGFPGRGACFVRSWRPFSGGRAVLIPKARFGQPLRKVRWLNSRTFAINPLP